MHALGWTTEARSENLFPLVMDSLCYLIDDGTYDEYRTGFLAHLVQMTNEAALSASSALAQMEPKMGKQGSRRYWK